MVNLLGDICGLIFVGGGGRLIFGMRRALVYVGGGLIFAGGLYSGVDL